MGSVFGDETKVTTIGIQRKDEGMSLSHHAITIASIQSSSSQYDEKRGELFHI